MDLVDSTLFTGSSRKGASLFPVGGKRGASAFFFFFKKVICIRDTDLQDNEAGNQRLEEFGAELV